MTESGKMFDPLTPFPPDVTFSTVSIEKLPVAAVMTVVPNPVDAALPAGSIVATVSVEEVQVTDDVRFFLVPSE